MRVAMGIEGKEASVCPELIFRRLLIPVAKVLAADL